MENKRTAVHSPESRCSPPRFSAFLTGAPFNFYAWTCGSLLTRAHSRTGDPARIAGYCGKSQILDEALAEWAESYGDQTEQDHDKLLASIKRGETKANLQFNDES